MVKLMYAFGRDGNMFYRVRYEIPDPFFLLDTGTRRYVFLDHREYGAFEEVNEDSTITLVALETLYGLVTVIPGNGSGVGKLALAILQKYGVVDEEIFVHANFPVQLADFLRSQGITLTPQVVLYPERVIKTFKEVSAVRQALVATQSAFNRIENILETSTIQDDVIVWQGVMLTSEILKIEAEKVLLELDMVSVEGIIISSGWQAAVPHHRGSGNILPNQTIVCDIFPRHKVTGFFADMTRTYVKGKPSPEVQRMYEAVMGVQQSVIGSIRPEVTFGSIHARAAQDFMERGYTAGPEGFTHSVGHGLGLDVHELPFAREEEALEAGHVITIEPGLYYKEFGGVRIEDVILVTGNGYENLTNYPNRFIIP